MATGARGFLFVAYEGPSETLSRERAKNPDKNRHVQLKPSEERVSSHASSVGHVCAPKRRQIRFNASGDAPGRAELPTGRCSICKKRRKLQMDTNACAPCTHKSQTAVKRPKASSNSSSPERDRNLYDSNAISLPVTCQISCGSPGCPADRKALQYFISFAALDLSAHVSVHFWKMLVLQAAQTEPMVRQAVLAVSSAHYDRCTSSVVSRTSAASYQIALHKLRTYLADSKPPSHELVLLCCILFFTFNRLQDDYLVASLHLKSAISILASSQSSKRQKLKLATNAGNNDDGDSIMRELTLTIKRLDFENSGSVFDRIAPLNMNETETDFYLQSPSMLKFWTIQDFLELWTNISYPLWAFMHRNASYRHVPTDKVPVSVLDERHQLLLWLDAWQSAARDWHYRHALSASSAFTAGDEDLSRQIIDVISALTLEIHSISLRGALIESLEDGRRLRPFDLFADETLSRAEKVWSLRQTYRHMLGFDTNKTWSSHIGAGESLVTLSHRTTSSVVRSRAQKLMRGFREEPRDSSEIHAFFAGRGPPPKDMVLYHELPGH